RRHIDRPSGATRIPVWHSSCFPRTVRPVAGMPGETHIGRLLEAFSRSAAVSSQGCPLALPCAHAHQCVGPPRQPRCRRLRAVRPEVLRRPPFDGLCPCVPGRKGPPALSAISAFPVSAECESAPRRGLVQRLCESG